MDAWHSVLRLRIRCVEVLGECRYENWNITTKTCVNEQLFHLGNGFYCVQSCVFLTKFGHRLLLFYLLSLIMCVRAGKKIISRTHCFMRQSNFRPSWGWSGGAMVLGKLPVLGRSTILITVGQGPIALAVGAGGGGLDIFALNYSFFSFCLSLGDGPI